MVGVQAGDVVWMNVSGLEVRTPGLAPPQSQAHHASQLRCMESALKTATIPSLRVEPALREAAESVLREGETLSGFVEASLRAQVRQRQLQDEFIKRGLTSLEESKRTGVYYTVDETMSKLRAKLEQAKAKAGKA